MTEEAQTKMAEMPKARPKDCGRNPRRCGKGVPKVTARKETSRPEESRLMEAVVERGNLTHALRRVGANKGAAGVDGMTVDELLPHLHREWPRIKEELLKGTYKPPPARTVEIPKRHPYAGHSDGPGTTYSAGVQSSIVTDLRTALLRVQLRTRTCLLPVC
jgi:hypothetical protein